MISVRQLSYRELNSLPGFQTIADEYALESSIPEMAPATEDLPLYIRLNDAGLLRVLAAFDDETLIGYMCFTVSPSPHYSKKIASTESFFVKPDYRKTGAGLSLLKMAELIATELGAACFLVTAPTGSKLCDVMEKIKGYRETNRVFFRSLL